MRHVAKNPFIGETMENTDAAVLCVEAADRLRRHVCGNYLSADKGFCFQVPPPSAKKETPVVIGTPPCKPATVAKKVLKGQQQTRCSKYSTFYFPPQSLI